MKSNFLEAAEIVHQRMLAGCTGYTPYHCLTFEESQAMFNVYGARDDRCNITYLSFENDEHKVTAFLLLHWIIEDLPEQ